MNNTTEKKLEYNDYVALVRKQSAGKFAYLRTLGCQQNAADSEQLAGIVAEMGYNITDKPEAADFALLNTCAVREHAELKALSIAGNFKALKEQKSSLVVGVFGCMMVQQHRADDIKNSHPYIDFTFGTGMLHRLPELLYNRLSGGKRQFITGFGEDDADWELPILRESSRQASVTIMSGCDNFCAYCIVPYVRGRERSRDADSVIAEVCRLVEQGYREITLLGQNVNSYRNPNRNAEIQNFTQLFRAVCEVEGDFVVRFMTSNPKDATTDLIDAIAESPRAARQLHLPLQAGSNATLVAMNRKYTRESFLELVEYARRCIPEISLTTDIIVGFPGEREADFEDTLDMLRRAEFDSMYSFIYSKRKGTPAAEMEGQVSREVKKDRFARLLAVGREISQRKNAEYKGKTIRVLAESYDKDKLAGRAENGRVIHFPGEPSLIGEWVNVKIKRTGVHSLTGEVARSVEQA
ncbi:MAG: tRNA (N6-isopentenyl adenosine(37)-C2)-methylthiotransferase MiaB [Oscillospiraceae bacterium]|nr:tRNA (N6-isopentenyl adenosine(37)-C2)-methylthiotransferase MiaB [Oscillospiraceae bacterium]